tara:strand:- start:690 stop:1406 length:717 start_codon:yes stop_codon:yes gene_type:complete
MNDKSRTIKDIIEYLTHVFNDQEIGAISQHFFKSIDELNEILNDYFIRFKNKDELNKAVKFNLEELKKLSFPRSKNDFHIVRDKDIDNTPDHSIEWHNDYSYIIHSHLIKVFEERIEIKKVKNNKRITIRDKKVYDLVKALNLKIDFLRDDCLPEEFVSVLIRKSEKNVHLNIKNRSFHYLLNKLKDYFYNFSITSVAETKKIHGLTGTLLTSKNLAASKSYSPKHKDAIDEVCKSFK